jgi:hypothetical protein
MRFLQKFLDSILASMKRAATEEYKIVKKYKNISNKMYSTFIVYLVIGEF